MKKLLFILIIIFTLGCEKEVEADKNVVSFTQDEISYIKEYINDNNNLFYEIDYDLSNMSKEISKEKNFYAVEIKGLEGYLYISFSKENDIYTKRFYNGIDQDKSYAYSTTNFDELFRWNIYSNNMRLYMSSVENSFDNYFEKDITLGYMTYNLNPLNLSISFADLGDDYLDFPLSINYNKKDKNFYLINYDEVLHKSSNLDELIAFMKSNDYVTSMLY